MILPSGYLKRYSLMFYKYWMRLCNIIRFKSFSLRLERAKWRYPAPNTNSIRDWFLSVCWQKPFWNNITELSCLGFEFKIFTKPLHFEMVRIRNLCQKKCMKYLVTRFLFCFDFGCQVIFYQTFSSFHFLGTFLEKLSLWLKSKNINSVMVIQNLDQ